MKDEREIELQAAIKEAERLVQERNNDLHEYRVSKHKFKIGDTFTLKGERARITKFHDSWGSPIPVACKFKKDGSISKREFYIYSTDFNKMVMENAA